jgi:hypothetical protein
LKNRLVLFIGYVVELTLPSGRKLIPKPDKKSYIIVLTLNVMQCIKKK